MCAFIFSSKINFKTFPKAKEFAGVADTSLRAEIRNKNKWLIRLNLRDILDEEVNYHSFCFTFVSLLFCLF